MVLPAPHKWYWVWPTKPLSGAILCALHATESHINLPHTFLWGNIRLGNFPEDRWPVWHPKKASFSPLSFGHRFPPYLPNEVYLPHVAKHFIYSYCTVEAASASSGSIPFASSCHQAKWKVHALSLEQLRATMTLTFWQSRWKHDENTTSTLLPINIMSYNEITVTVRTVCAG